MTSDEQELRAEVAALYLELMDALDGASLPAARTSLAMAMLMTGEHFGLCGRDLAEWIDQMGGAAKAVLGSVPRH